MPFNEVVENTKRLESQEVKALNALELPKLRCWHRESLMGVGPVGQQ
jgi:hypothetical protein